MINPYSSKIADAITEAEESHNKFSKSQTELIKSLPEEDRAKIFNAMMAEKKESSPRTLLRRIYQYWYYSLGAIIIILTIIFVPLKGWEETLKIIKQVLFFL